MGYRWGRSVRENNEVHPRRAWPLAGYLFLFPMLPNASDRFCFRASPQTSQIGAQPRDSTCAQEIMIVERSRERRRTLMKERAKGQAVIKYLTKLQREERGRSNLLRTKGRILAVRGRSVSSTSCINYCIYLSVCRIVILCGSMPQTVRVFPCGSLMEGAVWRECRMNTPKVC